MFFVVVIILTLTISLPNLITKSNGLQPEKFLNSHDHFVIRYNGAKGMTNPKKDLWIKGLGKGLL